MSVLDVLDEEASFCTGCRAPLQRQQKLALRVKSADAANEDRARLCGSRKAITPTCPACQGLSPWENWREAPERARLPFQYSRFAGF